MPAVPNATTSVNAAAGALAAGAELCCLLMPCPTNADLTPRLFGGVKAVFEQHGYCEGVEYAALHVQNTGKSLLVVGMPIATAGAVSRENNGGNTGTSAVTVAAGSDGVLSEHDGVVKVVTGGTIGTDQIVLSVSMDGGTTFKRVRLGTSTSYVVPYLGVTVSFAAGTLVAGDTVLTWFGSGPRASTASWQTARENLAAQTKLFRSIMLMGDMQDANDANAFNTQLNAYETTDKRFVYGRAGIVDRLPLAALSQVSVSMTGSPSLTFAEVGATGDTITRSAGSWITDGFQVGDVITVAGSASNNVTGPIASLTATVITLGTTDLVDEGPVSSVTVTASPGLTFANSGDTVTRNRGSWLTDGFRAGDSVTVAGSSGGTNDGTFVVDTVTALVLTFVAGGVDADEVAASSAVTFNAGQTKAVWMAAQDAAFETVDNAPRLDLSAGRGRVLSPFTQWRFRRPISWAASLREYQHDVHVTTWQVSDGPIGFDLHDAQGNLVEWDDRVDGGAGSAARFTTARTWTSRGRNAYITQSLTRATEGSLQQLTNNEAVLNVVQTTVQSATENVIGRSLELNDDGTATTDALNVIQSEVNSALELAVLKDRGEGKRASSAVFTPSSDDILNVVDAVFTSTTRVVLRGVVHTVSNSIQVASGGQ